LSLACPRTAFRRCCELAVPATSRRRRLAASWPSRRMSSGVTSRPQARRSRPTEPVRRGPAGAARPQARASALPYRPAHGGCGLGLRRQLLPRIGRSAKSPRLRRWRHGVPPGLDNDGARRPLRTSLRLHRANSASRSRRLGATHWIGHLLATGARWYDGSHALPPTVTVIDLLSRRRGTTRRRRRLPRAASRPAASGSSDRPRSRRWPSPATARRRVRSGARTAA
jgi:hypothetical protein